MNDRSIIMATARNDITGNALRSKPPSDKYNEGWERIFGKKNKDKKEEPKKENK